ncbi:unnamed protein product [Haemonchus placei]|uniref:Uncharacterized protein n=1 Tax=Haemonchus placei TaxID=6290 RepID=A0A0N4WYQ9_HAEPC|nr:unnamed protein product [Haemonchus placei]
MVWLIRIHHHKTRTTFIIHLKPFHYRIKSFLERLSAFVNCPIICLYIPCAIML